jgi:uncharacterized membrane protein
MGRRVTMPDLRSRARESEPALFVTAGVVVLFFGVAFLFKYAVDRGLIPIELRLAGAALGGMALLVLGFRTRVARPAFGLVLQGGGVGILYLTVFAAFRLYALVPGPLAFALLVLFVALSAALAVAQDSLALATLAAVGGFLAPILAETGEGSHVALFGYYAVLNAGILVTAWFRSYRLLNLLGFLFTFILSVSWGYRYYRPEYFRTTEPFLVLFVLIYVAIPIVLALRHASGRKAFVDGALVFGVPLVAALLQACLVRDFEYGMAWSHLAFGVFYVALALALFRIRPVLARDLAESFLGTGIVFSTLAVPFAFENLFTSAFWALEGAAMVWIGARQGRLLPRVSGCVLQLLASLAFLAYPGPQSIRPFLNAPFAGGVVIAIAGILTSLYLDRHRGRIHELERLLMTSSFAWGILWWLGNGLHEVRIHTKTSPDALGFTLLFLSFTAALSVLVGRALRWSPLEKVAHGFLPSLCFAAFCTVLLLDHPYPGVAGVGWVAAFLTHLFVARARKLGPLFHAGGLWLACFLTTWEASDVVHRQLAGPGWGDVMWGAVPFAFLLVVHSLGSRLPSAYLTWGAGPIAGHLILFSASSTFSGTWDPAPMPYVPFSSPIDVTVLLALSTVLHWSSRAPAFRAWTATAAFLWMHGVVLRAAHFGLGVPFEAAALLESDEVQTGFSILWAATGLLSMILGTKRAHREVWAVGAALMGAVVLKLFFVDLSSSGTLARIVSFLGVGILLVIVGYLSPVPPRSSRQEPSESSRDILERGRSPVL